MNFTVRLYWQHDLDLIALKEHPDFPFAKKMKEAIVACARQDKDFKIQVPPLADRPIEINEGCTIHFYLNNTTDADVIRMIQGIRSGFRNSAMRNIFRFYMEQTNLDPYYNTTAFVVKKNKKPSRTTSPDMPAPVLKKQEQESEMDKAQTTVNDLVQTESAAQKIEEAVIEPEGVVTETPSVPEPAPAAETVSDPEAAAAPVKTAPSEPEEPEVKQEASAPAVPEQDEASPADPFGDLFAGVSGQESASEEDDGFSVFSFIDEIRN